MCKNCIALHFWWILTIFLAYVQRIYIHHIFPLVMTDQLICCLTFHPERQEAEARAANDENCTRQRCAGGYPCGKLTSSPRNVGIMTAAPPTASPQPQSPHNSGASQVWSSPHTSPQHSATCDCCDLQIISRSELRFHLFTEHKEHYYPVN